MEEEQTTPQIQEIQKGLQVSHHAWTSLLMICLKRTRMKVLELLQGRKKENGLSKTRVSWFYSYLYFN